MILRWDCWKKIIRRTPQKSRLHLRTSYPLWKGLLNWLLLNLLTILARSLSSRISLAKPGEPGNISKIVNKRLLKTIDGTWKEIYEIKLKFYVFLLSFKLVRSSSDQTPDPRAHMEARSPTQHLPSFYALSKMRKSIREKRSQLVPRRQPTIDDVTKELESVRDDLQV